MGFSDKTTWEPGSPGSKRYQTRLYSKQSDALTPAARERLPVVIDGFIGGAAFLVARAFYPNIGSHVFWGHRSAETGHARLIREAQAEPLLDFGMRLGEGTGAALAMGVLIAALDLYREMATFAEASVSDKPGEGIK